MLTISATSINAEELTGRVSLDFRDAKVTDFITTIYRDVLGVPFVVDADLSNIPAVTISLPDQDPETLRKAAESVLNNHNLRVVASGGYTVITKSTPGTESTGSTVAIYQPRYRPLTDLKFATSQAGGQAQVSIYDDLMVITGTPEQVSVAQYIASHYDRPLNEIMLKISIVEFNSGDDSGVNFAGIVSALSEKISLKVGVQQTLRDSISFNFAPFEAIISAISNDSRFSILDTTTLRVANGKTARLNVGQEVPVLDQFTTTATGQVQQSVTYRPSGLLVDIKPVLINETIHASINQQLSSFAVTNTSTINSPTLLKRELKTEIAAQIGETVLLGGLDDNKSTDARSKILGIPLGKTSNKTKSSLLMLVQFTLN